MYTQFLMPIAFSLVLIFMLATSFFLIFSRKFRLSKDHSFISSILLAPFALSLFLYGLFYFFPSKPGYFYIILQSVAVLTLLLSQNRHFSGLFGDIKMTLNNVRQTKLSSTTKILIAIFSFVFFLCTLRIFFWPINWDDQIYYIEQSYAIGQSRSLKGFFDWGMFNNGIIQFSYNPAIRPGLPLIYSSMSLFSERINTSVMFSQIITFYFMLVSLGVFALIIKNINGRNYVENAFVSYILIFSSYQYVNHTVLGFKELPILCLVLLILDFVTRKNFSAKYFDFIYLGILTGIMSFINLSGSLLACIVLLIIFFITKANLVKKIGLFICCFTVLTLISGFEFPYFFSWTITGGTKSTNIVKPVANIIVNAIKPSNGDLTYQVGEFKSYGLINKFDVFTKGKLQGFFQFQFYGLIFWLFLLILIYRFKQLVGNRILKLILIFIGLYYLVFIDIFSLNPHQYAYVTTVSHKYTVFLIPFVSLIIGSQWRWVKNKLYFLNLKFFIICMLLISMFSILFIRNHYLDIFQLLSNIIPIHNPQNYYVSVISMINNVIFITTFFCFVVSIGAIVFFKRWVIRSWRNYSLGPISVIFFIFLIPSLIFFETNFGLLDTIRYSISSNEIKLSKIKGWESLYGMVNYLNKLPKQSNLLFAGSQYELMAIHLNINSNDIVFLPKATSSSDFQEIYDAVEKHHIKYVLMPSNIQVPQKEYLLKKTDGFSLYSSEFTN